MVVRFYRALINLDFKNAVLWYIKDCQLIRPPKIVLWAGALKKCANPSLGKPSNSGYNCKEMVKGYFPKNSLTRCVVETQNNGACVCRAALIIVEVKMFFISLSVAACGNA